MDYRNSLDKSPKVVEEETTTLLEQKDERSGLRA